MFTNDVSYTNILCPVDFSETSRKAFYRAVGYARLFGAKLTILHVREGGPPSSVDDVEEDHNELTRLEEGLVRRLDELEEDGKVSREERDRMFLEIRGGKPWLEILRFATDDAADLIVMGTHGHTGFRHIFMGSQADRVIRRAKCDVLTVKPDNYDPKLDLS
ncbi:MAG: universal stress protein [Deltaproteobacteria bacterium HGW-Deltaproteobacteria-14]|jgi:nucleotide-binding universal stress UspA family protein|nr:MAG: universal stress protein [Deltaproteobacteria bacterium HGW-Deltaproteobacteria-14]